MLEFERFSHEYIILKLKEIYEKKKSENYRRFLGILFVKQSSDYNQEIILSRYYIRDGILRNQGYNDFDAESYNFFLSKKLISLPDFDTNKMALTIFLKLKDEIDDKLDLDEFSAENLDNTDNYNIENSDDFEMQALMIQMGLPTQFGRNKMTNNNERKKSSNSQINDMRSLFGTIRTIISDLLNNPNDLIHNWIVSEKQKINQLNFSEFCANLLSSSMISMANKEEIKSLLPGVSVPEDLEFNLLSTFRNAIRDYSHRKLIELAEELDISDEYHNCMSLENGKYMQSLLNSIGLAYESELGLKNYNLYPVIPEKSITFSERNDLSLIPKFYEDFQDDLYAASDENDPMNKYYFQRYRFFDRFDDGILLDEESWYSVTPEVIAKQLADRYKQILGESKSSPVVIDAFCGAGGNAIRLAERGFIVIAIDMDNQKLKLLMHNASIYELDSRIVPVSCDFFTVPNWLASTSCSSHLKHLFSCALALHLSPPWGGPEYLDKDAFDIDLMQFDCLMRTALSLSPNVSCFIPRHSNCHQIVRWMSSSLDEAVKTDRVEIEQNCVQNKVKALTLYTGLLVQSHDLGLV